MYIFRFFGNSFNVLLRFFNFGFAEEHYKMGHLRFMILT